MNECGIILESFRINDYSTESFNISFTCKICGNRAHFVDRNIFPEITLADFISRIFKLHTLHNFRVQP